jgi:hypothetical protein
MPDDGRIFTILFMDSMGGFKKRALALLTDYLRIEYREKVVKAASGPQGTCTHSADEPTEADGEGDSATCVDRAHQRYGDAYVWLGYNGEDGYPRKLYNGRNVQVHLCLLISAKA